jgi:transcriptional regulator with XRE-family HTH domain
MNATPNVIKNDITADQVRAARGLLDWSQGRLADASGVPTRTVMRFEGRETEPRASTTSAIRAALELAGVEFIPENGGGPGVRWRIAC